jgi:hypothetical protein
VEGVFELHARAGLQCKTRVETIGDVPAMYVLSISLCFFSFFLERSSCELFLWFQYPNLTSSWAPCGTLLAPEHYSLSLQFLQIQRIGVFWRTLSKERVGAKCMSKMQEQS